MNDSAVGRFAGLGHYLCRNPGADAPGFTPSCAPSTLLRKNRKIASLTPQSRQSITFVAILGLTPQALCRRALRALYC
jgi:hypothetical protein